MSIDAETFRVLAERVARLEGRLDAIRIGGKTGPPNRTAAALDEIRTELRAALAETKADVRAVMRHLGVEEERQA